MNHLNDSFDYKDFNLLNEYWLKYAGQFKEDCKEGKGTLFISNGEKFEGNFTNDIIQGIYFQLIIKGEGVYHTKGGIIHGIWRYNKLI